MIVALIAACEIGFWVLLAAGLAFRYLLRMPRTGLALLLCEPLLEVVLLVATALDLKNGAEPNWTHGLAALYIGYTVGHGHRTVKWLDGHAAHRFGGAPPPQRPPRYGMARARHEGKVWTGTLVGAAVATVLLQLAIWYVDDPSRVTSLESWRDAAWRAAGIHGLVALSYWIWPRKAPAGETEVAQEKEGVR
ncbi:Integral membrane protein OS=Streptomyces violarus OX=67380 GN=FHS41_002210 PE=4 SV=1 [Streptomyces violarus]